MRLVDHDEADDRKVWLDRSEVETFLSYTQGTEQRLALGLGARCGLRAKEIVEVCPQDVVEDETVGGRVRVREAKGDEYREVPIPVDLRTTAQTLGEVRDDPADEPLVGVTTRTIGRWVDRVAETCAEQTGDDGWHYLAPHDLRRTWGTLLLEAEVEPGMVMQWGGWSDWDTFREHYLGAYSPEMERRQVEKVAWL